MGTLTPLPDEEAKGAEELPAVLVLVLDAISEATVEPVEDAVVVSLDTVPVAVTSDELALVVVEVLEPEEEDEDLEEEEAEEVDEEEEEEDAAVVPTVAGASAARVAVVVAVPEIPTAERTQLAASATSPRLSSK